MMTINTANLSTGVEASTLTVVSEADALKLAAVYIFVVENWAVHASEVAEFLTANETVKHAPEVNRLLKRLESDSLVVSMHVNEERALTWQSYFDVNNGDSMDEAEQRFIDTYRIDVRTTAAASGRVGATGPRYSAEQLSAGRDAREVGASWPNVALAAGVKSPSYFSNVLRATFPEMETMRVEKVATLKALAAIEAAATPLLSADEALEILGV